MNKWYNIELTNYECDYLTRYLNKEGYKYETSVINNKWKHIEIYTDYEGATKINNYMDKLYKYSEIL